MADSAAVRAEAVACMEQLGEAASQVRVLLSQARNGIGEAVPLHYTHDCQIDESKACHRMAMTLLTT